MEVKGTIKRIGEEQVITEAFKKRVLHVTTGDKYPQIVELQAAQDKCDLLNGLEVDQEVTVHFNLRGREWQNNEGIAKVFNTLDLWKIDKGEEF